MSTALPPSRDEAQARGSLKYQTGVPCRRGHNAPRWTSNGACCACTTRRVDRPSLALRTNVQYMPIVFPELIPLANGALIQRMTPPPECVRFVQGKLFNAVRQMCIEWEGLPEAGSGTLKATSKAGAPLDQYRKAGWTDAQLLKEGLAIEVRA